jgi:hypothetical protein
LEEAYFLAEAWPNTIVIITSRFIPCLESLEEQAKIQVPQLSEQQVYELIKRIVGQGRTTLGWPDSLQDAIRRPLFALILARYWQ